MRTIGRSGKLSGLMVAVAAVVGGMAGGAYAQTVVSWVGATGDYNSGGNWSSGVTPANANNEFLMINNGGTAVVAAGGEGAFLNLGLNPGDTGSLQITGGTLTLGELRVGGRETIPDFNGGSTPVGGGTGSVVQTGGTVSVTYSTGTEPPIQSTYIGDAGLESGNTADGSYTIKNDAVLINGIANNDQLVIGTGAGAHGAFLQQDTSTVTSSGYVIVARQGAVASYDLQGGTLNAQGNNGMWVGDGASADGTALVAGTAGTFTQSGNSAVNLAAALEIGRRGGTGTYTMSGGSLTTGAELRVGSNGNSGEAAVQAGNGTFNLSNGTVNVGTNLHVGIGGGSTANTVTGTLNMTGGTINLLASNAVFAVGNGLGTTGTVNQSAGVISGSGASVDIGRNNGGPANYNLSGTGELDVKQVALATTTNAGAGAHNFTMTGGTLNVTTFTYGSGQATVSRTFTMGGGVANIGTLNLGGGTNSNGAFVYNGGTLRVDSMTLASTSHTTINADIDFRNQANTGGTSVAVGNALVEVTGSAHATLGGAMTINSRTLTKTGSGTLTIGGPLTDSGSATFTVNEGTLVMTSTAGGNLTINANSNVNFGADQNLAALNISGGLVDLDTHSMTLVSPAPNLVGDLASAYNGGTWTGTTGLTSTAARNRAGHATGLGYFDDGAHVLVEYTWAGDLNLDGRMNGDDYTLIDRQVALYGLNSAGVWRNGDVNYDGVVNAGDYMAIDTAYFYSNGSLAPGILAEREAEFGTGYVNQLMAAVPEPGSAGLLAVGVGAALAGRRRRREGGVR